MAGQGRRGRLSNGLLVDDSRGVVLPLLLHGGRRGDGRGDGWGDGRCGEPRWAGLGD